MSKSPIYSSSLKCIEVHSTLMHFNELEQIPPGLAWNPSVLYIPGHSTWNPVQWNEEFWWWETVLWWGLIPLHSTSLKWNEVESSWNWWGT